MKLRRAVIRNFKGVKICDIDFLSHGEPRQVTALIGDNGSGKTSVLQAIALILSLATRRTRAIEFFAWHGFLPDRVASLGNTSVVLEVAFDETEVKTTQLLFEEWQQSLSSVERGVKRLVPPSDRSVVTLEFRNGRLNSPERTAALHQFLGRYYIGHLAKSRPDFRDRYQDTGGVFWFDQMRNLGRSLTSWKEEENQSEYAEGWQSGVEQLRKFLVGWWAHHTTPEKRGRDYIPELERAFNLVFPGVVFRGVMPKGDTVNNGDSHFYFLLERDGKVFDIAEMSSGEQAVFPLIYEFVRLNIARSIVLIDELELHLHPPQQQALLRMLPKLGPDCQFVITTHSDFLTRVIPDEHQVRLEGGRPCL